MSEGPSSAVGELKAALERTPFAPFGIETSDGRRLAVPERGRVVLNSLAVSVIEEAFSVTVVALDHVKAVVFD